MIMANNSDESFKDIDELSDKSLEDELNSLKDEENEKNEKKYENDKKEENEKKKDYEKKDDLRRKKYRTTIKEFNFQRKEKAVVQKIMKSKRIREILQKKSLENIVKKANISKKMLIKTINTIYTNLINKYKQDDLFEDLLEYIYLDFESKNSLKKVVDRKTMSFLCNLFKHADVLKVQNCLKFLDLSEKVKIPGLLFKKESFFLYLSGFDTFLKPKVGVLNNFDDFSEFPHIPLAKSLDFFKEKFSDIFPFQRLQACFEYLEKHSFYDKKRIYKSGLIDLELVLTYAINQYEDHCIAVNNTGKNIIKAITCDNNPLAIKKSDLGYVSNLFKSHKHLKDLDRINGEFLKIEAIFESNARDIFPEEILDKQEKNYDHVHENILELIRNNFKTDKNGFFKMIEENADHLDLEILPYLEKILELHLKIFVY